MNSPIRVLILEQEESFRQVIRSSIDRAEGLAIVGGTADEVETGQQAAPPDPDVILVGMETLAPEGVLDVTRATAQYPQSRLLVWNRSKEPDTRVLDLFKSGIRGYLEGADCRPAEIVAAIRTIHRGGVILNPRMARLMLDEIAHLRSLDTLTEGKGGEHNLSVEMLQALLQPNGEDGGANVPGGEHSLSRGEQEQV